MVGLFESEVKNETNLFLHNRFDDCLKLNRRIDEGPYMLPDPEILHTKATEQLKQPRLDLAYTHSHSDSTDGIPHAFLQKSRIFADKKFYLGKDLDIHTQLSNTLQNIIKQGGGKIASTLEEANVLLCQWREGEQYLQASRKRIDVGNLTWLYWMIAKNQWASPTRILLHYPRSKTPIPGMENMVSPASSNLECHSSCSS